MTSWPRALQPWSPWPAAYVACGNTFRTKPSEEIGKGGQEPVPSFPFQDRQVTPLGFEGLGRDASRIRHPAPGAARQCALKDCGDSGNQAGQRAPVIEQAVWQVRAYRPVWPARSVCQDQSGVGGAVLVGFGSVCQATPRQACLWNDESARQQQQQVFAEQEQERPDFKEGANNQAAEPRILNNSTSQFNQLGLLCSPSRASPLPQGSHIS